MGDEGGPTEDEFEEEADDGMSFGTQGSDWDLTNFPYWLFYILLKY